jgi:hypothetical protein
VLQPHFGASVRMKLTLPKVGTWSPPGFPKTQSLIAGAKTPYIEIIFIPLERSWNVDVQNGLAWPIQTSAAQVMVEKKDWESNWQFDSRPLKVRNRPDPGVFRWSATHRWKALEESYKFIQTSSQSKVWTRSYELPKSWESKLGHFRDSSLGVPGQKAIRM